MDAPHRRWLKGWRKRLKTIRQECCEQYWTSPGDSTPQSSSYTATYHPSRKLSKLDEPDRQDNAGEVGTSLWVVYSCGPLHMDKQKQDVQFEPTYSRSVPIRDIALMICRKQWTIGRCGKRGSGISVLIARHDDDDDSLQIFQTSVGWGSFTEVWLTANYSQVYTTLFSNPADLTVLWSGRSWFFLWFSIISVFFPGIWILFQVTQLQLVSLSPSCSIAFSKPYGKI